jgi:hypothetical protein
MESFIKLFSNFNLSYPTVNPKYTIVRNNWGNIINNSDNSFIRENEIMKVQKEVASMLIKWWQKVSESKGHQNSILNENNNNNSNYNGAFDKTVIRN